MGDRGSACARISGCFARNTGVRRRISVRKKKKKKYGKNLTQLCARKQGLRARKPGLCARKGGLCARILCEKTRRWRMYSCKCLMFWHLDHFFGRPRQTRKKKLWLKAIMCEKPRSCARKPGGVRESRPCVTFTRNLLKSVPSVTFPAPVRVLVAASQLRRHVRTCLPRSP